MESGADAQQLVDAWAAISAPWSRLWLHSGKRSRRCVQDGVVRDAWEESGDSAPVHKATRAYSGARLEGRLKARGGRLGFCERDMPDAPHGGDDGNGFPGALTISTASPKREW